MAWKRHGTREKEEKAGLRSDETDFLSGTCPSNESAFPKKAHSLREMPLSDGCPAQLDPAPPCSDWHLLFSGPVEQVRPSRHQTAT